jgi:hypothetical protein
MPQFITKYQPCGKRSQDREKVFSIVNVTGIGKET